MPNDSVALVGLGTMGCGMAANLQKTGFSLTAAWLERLVVIVSKVLQVLKNRVPGSPLLRTISERMVKRDYAVNFLLPLMAKDATYAHAGVEKNGVDLTTALNVRRLFERATKEGHGEQDLAVVEVLRQRLKRWSCAFLV